MNNLVENFTSSAQKDNVLGLKEIISKGVNINGKDDIGNTALIIATFFGNKDSVELLVKAKADLNIQDEANRSAVDWAIIRGHVDCAAILILAGADTERIEKQYRPMYDSKREEIAEICTEIKNTEKEFKEGRLEKQRNFRAFAKRRVSHKK